METTVNNDMGLIANDPITDELQNVALGAYAVPISGAQT